MPEIPLDEDQKRQPRHQWLDENAPLLLRVNYFLVTFTVPEGLRRWIRANPRLGNDLLLAASSQALQDLAQNPKRLGANRQLQLLPHGRLRWPFRHSGTGTWQSIDLQPFEFLRRFLQHVLPSGFHRVRRFGWLHPGGRAKLKRVRALLKIPPLLSAAEQAAWQPPAQCPGASPTPAPQPDALPAATLRCPHCGHPLVLVSQWRPGQNGRPLLPNPALVVPRTTGPP